MSSVQPYAVPLYDRSYLVAMAEDVIRLVEVCVIVQILPVVRCSLCKALVILLVLYVR